MWVWVQGRGATKAITIKQTEYNALELRAIGEEKEENKKKNVSEKKRRNLLRPHTHVEVFMATTSNTHTQSHTHTLAHSPIQFEFAFYELVFLFFISPVARIAECHSPSPPLHSHSPALPRCVSAKVCS